MSGYCENRMSINAIHAYETGEKPKSKWTKADIIEYLPDDLQVAAERLTAKEAKGLFLYWSSWHHTSATYNRTDFYEVRCDHVTVEMIDEIIANRTPAQPKQPEPITKAYVRFGEWVGSFKHPKLIYHEDYAIIRGSWAYFKNGSKKRTDGKHFKILETFNKAPRGHADTFKTIMKNI